MNLENKVVVLTTLPNMVPVGTMIKEKISSLYAADVAERTLRDELLEKGLIKKVEQVVVETATEEVVEEAPEAATPNIHEVNIKIIQLEGIERAFENVEYLNGLFDKRLASGDFRVTSPEETLVSISLEKIQGYNLDEVKGEIRSLKLQKRELLKEIEAKETIKAEEAEKAEKAAAKDEVVARQVIKEIITEDVAEATNVDETIVHKVLIRITRQRSAAKARAVLAAKRAQAKVKAQATNIFALLGLNIEVLTDVTELMYRTNASMKEAWTWFHKYATAPEVNYGRRFI